MYISNNFSFSLLTDETPPLLSCPQSYIIELVDKQDSYVMNFNETRRRVNVSDASGEVGIPHSYINCLLIQVVKAQNLLGLT